MNAQRRLRVVLVAASCVAAACHGAPTQGEEPVAGAGLLHASPAPSADVVRYHRPVWRVGDRFTLVRGEQLRGAFEVVAADADGYAIDMGDGRVLRRDLDLGNVGQWLSHGEDAELQRRMAPVDVRYHWPLWVGKTWSCEFVDQVVGAKALCMRADYHVEALDHVAVPAGAFDALRIVRRLRLAEPGAEGHYLTRTQVAWFAPALGIEVRQLLGDTFVELVEFERGGS